MTWWHVIQHWLAVHTGTVNESGPFYGFWSGFGSDIGEVTIVGGLVVMVRQHQCQAHRCWRLRFHTTAAGHAVCKKHHEQVHGGPLTLEDIQDAHDAATP